MAAALDLAARGLGAVWPNPAVGCVLVRNDRVVGRGWTQPGGRPHAETEALRRAGELAAGATAYVTLEPCAHQGKAPPCADALIAAKVARVVAALEDPDPRVGGRGLARLREAGIVVDTGIGQAAAADLNAGFLCRLQHGRPLVTLKLASSLDGRIATHGGESKWITGEAARARAHLLRAQHDGIMVGVGTAALDDPDLTCRLPGMADRSPIRIVVDGHLRLPLTSRLVRSADKVPIWLAVRDDADPARLQAYQQCGVEIIPVAAGSTGMPDLQAVLRALGERGMTRVLAEGGSRLAASLVRDDLVDRLAWFQAPKIIGGDGLAAIEAFGLDRLLAAPLFRATGVLPQGDDLLETFIRHD